MTSELFSLFLVWPFELGVGELHRDGRRQSLPDVLGMEGLFLVLLELAALERVPVEDAGQSGLQALDVGAPVDGGDDVGERVGALVFVSFAVPGRPLQGHLDRYGLLGELGVGVVLR